MKRRQLKQDGEKTVPSEPRNWLLSAVIAMAFISASLALSAWINPKFGRVMHWDWVAGGAPVLFALFTLALRRRWV